MGSLCGTLLAVLVVIMTPLGDSVVGKLPGLPLVRKVGESIIGLSEEWRVKKEEKATIPPPGLVGWEHGEARAGENCWGLARGEWRPRPPGKRRSMRAEQA